MSDLTEVSRLRGEFRVDRTEWIEAAILRVIIADEPVLRSNFDMAPHSVAVNQDRA
jgi:hypothetical protein